ncbi:unnamed protein product [Rotaria socialis]|uniref:Uncharacterized protein n=1 Tax=Rotaria socialis TaxID=392032 RepID=A0A818DL74_9BILA|nr:unnamed protein product [Rotaria socialis]CAF3509154.1 unnamed protein product [Rotaria socialis]CAF4404944.1 unnamed protein product [Rotaria socialis]CAF4626238.1 unnamed protein product [Rotaria socialis]
MHYQRLTDDASIVVDENGESQLLSSSLDSDKKICYTRKIILSLLTIQIVLCLLLLVADVRLLIKNRDDNLRQGLLSLGPILFSFVYYGCGLIVVYRIHYLGIAIFGWAGYLQYVVLCGEMFLNVLIIAKHRSNSKHTNISYSTGVIITVISLCQAILMVITCKLTFKIFNLIKTFKRDALGQV